MTTPVPAPTAADSAAGRAAFRPAARASGMRPSAIREILKITESPEVISFAGGLPAPELFPLAEMARASAAVFAADGVSALQYGTTEGFRPLREWVCSHLAGTVGLAVPPDQILITHGSQQGLDLVAKVLVDPGDTVLVENPAYLGALQAFQVYGAGVIGVPADGEGMRPDALRDALERASRRPKFIYLIPNFQNPTGTSLSAARRGEIARLANEHGVPVVEDDPYGALRFAGDAPPALGAPGGARDWIYLGTASKILAPGLRVAWLAASDRSIFATLVTAKQSADLHTSALAQRLVWECVRPPGLLDAHVGRLRTAYARRRDVMFAALEKNLPDGCAWTRPDGGLFLWVTLPHKIDATELLRRAAAERVAFVPGEPFWVGAPQRNTLRLNFSNAAEPRIREGVARLGRVIAAALK